MIYEFLNIYGSKFFYLKNISSIKVTVLYYLRWANCMCRTFFPKTNLDRMSSKNFDSKVPESMSEMVFSIHTYRLFLLNKANELKKVQKL